MLSLCTSVFDTYNCSTTLKLKCASLVCVWNITNLYANENGPLARYVTLRGAHAPGMPGTLSLTADSKGGENLPGIPGACAPSIFLILQEAHKGLKFHIAHTRTVRWFFVTSKYLRCICIDSLSSGECDIHSKFVTFPLAVAITLWALLALLQDTKV